LKGRVSAEARALLRHRLKSINKNADEELHDEEGSNDDNGKEEEACLGEVICDRSTACEAQKPTNNYYTQNSCENKFCLEKCGVFEGIQCGIKYELPFDVASMAV